MKPATPAEEMILASYGYLTLKELREKCDAKTSTKTNPPNNSTAEAAEPPKRT